MAFPYLIPLLIVALLLLFNILPLLGLTLHLPWIMFVNSCTPQLIFIWLLLNTSSDFSESPLTMVFYFNLVLLSLFAYTDADPAGDTSDRRSISGFIVFLAHNCITWSAKMRTTMSRSSTEAEYHSLASTVVALCWLRMDTWVYSFHKEFAFGVIMSLLLPSHPTLSSMPEQKHIEANFRFMCCSKRLGGQICF